MAVVSLFHYTLHLTFNFPVFQASYTAGARIRKIVSPLVLKEVAYFDMEQSCESINSECDDFAGVWTYFPFYESGITVAGSQFQGLFMLQPFLDTA